MKDLALDQGETMRTIGKTGEAEGEELDRVDMEGRGACFFGGFDNDDPQTQQEEVEGIPHGPKFDLSRAVPTVHQPVFDQEGRWVPYDRVKEFRENGMDVPRHLKEALDLARSSNASGMEESVEREAVREEVDVDDGFDNDGLMEFYGQTRRSRDPFAANHNHTPTARERQREMEHVERMRTGGYTSRETREAWMESEDALDKVLGDEKQEEARRQGYYQDKRRGVGAGMDGKYLFISENPYVPEGGRMEEMISLGEAAGPMELQYQVSEVVQWFEICKEPTDAHYFSSSQNLLEHEARVLQDPSSSRAWFDLAIKQQELERDDQAIRALLQCISLDPDCKEAYLALSVSYTNEGMIREGHSVLERWVEGSSGSRLDENKGDDADLGRFDVGPGAHKNQRHEVLTRELMRMARMMPEGDIDADVQVALGVLFNASEEYEKAQDCFRAALFARQDVSRVDFFVSCPTLAVWSD
jgi:tetratricopeptide (TPR) repeat protein